MSFLLDDTHMVRTEKLIVDSFACVSRFWYSVAEWQRKERCAGKPANERSGQ
jgi:hypothetical protein